MRTVGPNKNRTTSQLAEAGNKGEEGRCVVRQSQRETCLGIGRGRRAQPRDTATSSPDRYSAGNAANTVHKVRSTKYVRSRDDEWPGLVGRALPAFMRSYSVLALPMYIRTYVCDLHKYIRRAHRRGGPWRCAGARSAVSHLVNLRGRADRGS